MPDLDFHSIISGFLKLVLLAGGTFYAGLVLTSYRTEGAHPRPEFNWRDPAHSVEHWAVWLGVKAVTLAEPPAMAIFGMLSEASADVGEWFLSRRHESH